MTECNNLYKGKSCDYCKKNYNVSSEFYEGKRQVNGAVVKGYAVWGRDGNFQGILNSAMDFKELAYVDESSLKKQVI